MKRMPLTGIAFFMAAAAICGLPPLNGFMSEFLIYLSGLQAFREESFSAATGSLLVLATVGGMALIGGLAAACFTKAVGIVFLGEPRTEAATSARAPGKRMLAPMLVLAAGCLLTGLAVRPLLAGLVLPLGTVLDQPAHVIAAHLAPALGPLTAVVIVGAIVIGLIAVLSVMRHWLLRSREVHGSVTWDCGYAAPTARMQYTSTLFVQPLGDFFSLVLRTRKHIDEPNGRFPMLPSRRPTTRTCFSMACLHELIVD